MSKKDFQNWSKEKLLHEYKELLKRKKFGIVWENKPEDVAEQCKTFLPVLKEEKKKNISSDKNHITHIMIEGDNYHALSVLNYTHRHKIDVIYIDPPYNTGARDWKYNNDYVDKNDMYRHSKWLSFMSKRLRMAKRLLTYKGVLVCTVDDNEFTKLGLLLEEIFPSYQITCITIVHNPAGIQGDNFSYCHEYAYFVYPKGGRYIARQVREEEIDVRNFRDVTGDESLRGAAANCFYPIYIKDGEIVGFGPVSDKNYHPKINVVRKDKIIEVYPVDPQGIERKWRFARQSVEPIQDQLEVKYIKNRKVFDIIRSKNTFNYKTVWTDSKYSANNHGTQLLNKIIEKGSFSFPKSLYAVIDCIKAASNEKKDAIILDFFAGSGTTGHAVLELNKKDGGTRQFILCTNNEDNNGSGTKIARDICYPRIKKVMQGYKTENGEKIDGFGGNLKYFTTPFVGNVKTDNDKRILTSRCTEMLCLAETTFDEVANKKGMFAIYENQKQMTGIIYDEDAIADFKKEVKKHKKPIVVYVFSYDHTYNEEDFEDLDNLKVVKPIPEVILNVYRKIYKELYKPRNL